MRQNGFAPLLVILTIAILGAVGYFGYKNYGKQIKILPEPSCKINCPSPTPIPKPGTIKDWVVYSDPQTGFSFEYPKSWFYEGQLCNVSKSERDSLDSKPVRNANDYFCVPMGFANQNQKLSDYIDINYLSDLYFKYKIVSKTHTFFGRRDVVTYKFCNSVSVFMKGANVEPGKYCIEQSYIDFGNKGFINVALEATTAIGTFAKEAAIYKQVLSTIKLTN